MYATIADDGSFEIVKAEPNLAALQGAVEGHIELVRCSSYGLDMWVNEEGKLTDKPLNPLATAMARMAGAIFPTDVVMGRVAFTGGADREGNTLPLTDDQITILRYLLEACSPLAIGILLRGR